MEPGKRKYVLHISMVVSVVITVVFIVRIWMDGMTFWRHGAVAYDVTGQVGDFIGGVVGTILTFVSVLLVYRTFVQQIEMAKKREFESHFYTLLEIHRKNVEDMRFDATGYYHDSSNLSLLSKKYNGYVFFEAFLSQVLSCKNELRPFVDYYSKTKSLFKDGGAGDHRMQLEAKLDIAFCTVFYGVEGEGKQILRNLLKKKYAGEFVDSFIDFLSLKPAANEARYKVWRQFDNKHTIGAKREIVGALKATRNMTPFTPVALTAEDMETIANYSDNYPRYYCGFYSSLGHYYRQLFQLVKYVNENEDLDYEEKYSYIKILRAQLSDYEQTALFMNSMSALGRKWERCPEVNPSLPKYTEDDFKLISKYHLIKNIPQGIMFEISTEEFYPRVSFDYMDVEPEAPRYR